MHLTAALAKLLLLAAAATSAAACAKATYRLTLTTKFSRPQNPLAPPNAHLSPLTAFSHTRRFSRLVRYGYASPGVKDVAELGDPSRLRRELDHPLVLDVGKDDRLIFDFGETFTLKIDVDCVHPFVSAVTMVAPSPDWMVALANLDMRDEEGDFVAMRSGDLGVYDAGTDCGTTFTARDCVSDPVENIAPLMDPPVNTRPAASYKLELMCPRGRRGRKCRRMMRM